MSYLAQLILKPVENEYTLFDDWALRARPLRNSVNSQHLKTSNAYDTDHKFKPRNSHYIQDSRVFRRFNTQKNSESNTSRNTLEQYLNCETLITNKPPTRLQLQPNKLYHTIQHEPNKQRTTPFLVSRKLKSNLAIYNSNQNNQKNRYQGRKSDNCIQARLTLQPLSNVQDKHLITNYFLSKSLTKQKK